MPNSDIVIKGAREHNLRDVDLILPRNKLICLTGVSGSGKSSLAFDTLYAEGQRRYVESLSSFARQFLGQMPKPDVDYIGGLSPSISISQKSAGTNPRSTVGTITEIYDYLRVLFARIGDGRCPSCKRPVTAQSREQILARILMIPQEPRVYILAPVIRGQKGEYRDLFEEYLKQGFVRARVDGEIVSLSGDQQLDRQMRHDIEIVVDRLTVRTSSRARLAEAVETALKVGKGTLIVAQPDSLTEDTTVRSRRGKTTSRRRQIKRPGDMVMSVNYACTECGISFEPPSPQLFSFNSPQGMCLECDGLGEFYSFDIGLLIPDPKLSFKQGCFELLGPWKDMGRWRRHIYQGVAETFERIQSVADGAMLETPWSQLDRKLQEAWLWGTGDLHITFTWRGGKSPMKYGGTFEGIVPDLMSKYRNSKSRMQLRQLEKYMSTVECPECRGERLNAQSRSVTVCSTHPSFADRSAQSLPEVCRLSVAEAIDFFQDLKLDATRTLVAREVLKEIRGRLGFLNNVGLDYLSLDRSAPTLSGGESQRIRLAGQIGCGLVGVLYILDEPSIGLHPRDNDRLIETLGSLRDLGNTVVVVEHDEDTMRASDHIIDFGPGPGIRGGHVVAAGSVEKLVQSSDSVTGQFLAGKRQIDVPSTRRLQPGLRTPVPDSTVVEPVPPKKSRRRLATDAAAAVTVAGEAWLSVVGAQHNNLKHVDFAFPLGSFICVTGVSGSGKSSLVNDILVEALRRDLNQGDGDPGAHEAIVGLEHLDKMIAIDQSPIGRTPRSNPGTYIKLFDDIRNLFTQLPESKKRGYKPGTFAMMCYACIHCNTLGDFLERSTRFNYLVTDCVSLRLERNGKTASYIVTPGAGMVDPDNFFTHILLSLAHRLSNWLINQCLVLESVNFTHARPHYANEYNFLFGAPINFDQPENKLCFSSNYLDMPLKQNEQTLDEFLKLPAMQLMSIPDAGNSFVAKVKDMIQLSIAEQCPEFEDIASDLHTTSVTLRRRLRQEGTSYQQIKDDVRRDTAVYNLSRGTMSIESVAESVGFSETTSFFRAFKRWTGVTPRAYIKRETAG